MTATEAREAGLTIRRDLWYCPMGDFRYKPYWMSVYELSDLTNIDRSTILAWCKKGLKHTPGVPGHRPTKISMHHFVMWVLYRSKYKTMNGIAGRKWTDEELLDVEKSERTNLAKRIQKYRLQRLKQ